MLLEKLNKIRQTLSFRLTIGYAGIFTLSTLLVLSVIYYRAYSITMELTDKELREEVDELSALITEKGIKQFSIKIAAELEEEGEDSIFYRLILNNSTVITEPSPRFWGRPDMTNLIRDALNQPDQHIFKTLSVPGLNHKVRILSKAITPTAILQFGLSLEKNEEYLEIFRNLFLWLMLPLFIGGGLIGWFMAKNALAGFEQVTQVANHITGGNFDKRVKTEKHFYEISRLTNAFNTMLDRIQSLLKGMREMTDNIAHDLRSPLTRIRGIAEMTLTSKTAIEDYENMAVNTIEECDNLIQIINTMLDITEIEAGVGTYEFERVDLVKLIADACELFRPIADQKEVNIFTNLPDQFHLNCDKHKLQQLVFNILENSIKYTPTGGRVTVAANTNKENIEIIFEDTGIGISKTDLPRIFERFYRGDRSRSQEGVGLGLSLAKAIAEGFGGKIKVNSIPDVGSEFTVSMPSNISPSFSALQTA